MWVGRCTQEEEIKSRQVVKEETKLSVFIDDNIVNTENLKDSKKKIQVINEFNKITDKICTKKSISFLQTSLVVQWITQGTQV